MKKRVRNIFLIVICSLLLGGCSQSQEISNDISREEGYTDKKQEQIKDAINLQELPIVEESITLNIAAIKGSNILMPYSEMPVLKDFEEKTNIVINWEEINLKEREEKINLMFNSNNLPDAFYGETLNDTQLVRYAQAGAIVALNDLINQYAPYLKAFMESRPDYTKNISLPNGDIYSLASLIEEERTVSSLNMFINKKWLDTLGLEVPTTSDELYEVLKAFKTGDPNGNGKQDEIPFSVSDKAFSIRTMFGMFGLPDNKRHLSIRNGEVIYTAIQPEYKEGIKYFNKLYTEGLLDEEMFVQDMNRLKAKGYREENIIGMTLLFWPDDAIPKERQDEYIHLLPLEGPGGDRVLGRSTVAPGLSKNTFTITKACQYPEVAIRWIDEWAKAENSLKALNGIKDNAWGYTKDGKWKTYSDMELPEKMTYDQYRYTQTPGVYSFYLIPKDLADKRDLDGLNKAQNERYLAYEPFLEAKENVIPPLYQSAEVQDEIATITQDLNTYVEQKRMKWITEGGVDIEWEDYINQVKILNVDRLLELYQKGLEGNE